VSCRSRERRPGHDPNQARSADLGKDRRGPWKGQVSDSKVRDRTETPKDSKVRDRSDGRKFEHHPRCRTRTVEGRLLLGHRSDVASPRESCRRGELPTGTGQITSHRPFDQRGNLLDELQTFDLSLTNAVFDGDRSDGCLASPQRGLTVPAISFGTPRNLTCPTQSSVPEI
jgi:hypothetical protein